LPQSPEIFEKRLDDLDLDGLPDRDDPEFESAVILALSMQYAAKGHSAAITTDGEFVRGVAVPQEGIEPREYVLGLLRDRYLEEALPPLSILAKMLGDAETLYNYGLCLSELGRPQEAIEPLRACLEDDPDYNDARTALGVALIKTGDVEEAEKVLRAALKRAPEDHWANRNLGALLSRTDRPDEAVGLFRTAIQSRPTDPGAIFGLAQSLEELGGEQLPEADELYKRLISEFPQHPVSQQAKDARTRIANRRLKGSVDGELRMDAVMYMHRAFEQFGAMERPQLGQIVLEIARKGETGLDINNPDKRYTLKSLDGDFSGLQLLSLMHVGLKILEPSADPQSGLDDEYEAAKEMSGN